MAKWSKFIRILLYVLFILVLSVSLFDAAKVDIDSVWKSPSHELSEGWTLTVEGLVVDDDFSVPTVVDIGSLKGKSIILSRKLSEDGTATNSLMFRTSQKTVQVYLDGEEIYNYDANLSSRRGKIPGYISHFVWLPKDYRGKIVEIAMVGHSEKTSGTFYPVYLGSRVSQIMELLIYDGFSLFFGILILLTSATVFLLAVTLFRKMEVRKSAIAFAGIELCAGTWIVSGSMSVQLLIHNQVFMLLAGVVSMYLLPVFITRFVTTMYKIPQSVQFNRVVQIFPIAFIVFSLLQYYNVATYYASFTPGAIVLFIYLLALVWFCYKAYRQGNREIRQFLIAILWLLSSVFGELVLLLLPRHTLLNALVFHVAILAFGLVLLRQVLRHVMIFVEQRGKEEYLLSLANTDGLTGVANRRAFEDRLSTLRGKPFENPVGLMIFDVNNLKELNDEKGHVAGDELLKLIAGTLEKSFSQVGTVYRIGGDEFAMICSPCSTERYEVARDALFTEHRELGDASSAVSIAFGEAFWAKEDDFESIDELFSVADGRMYKHKIEMKRGVVR